MSVNVNDADATLQSQVFTESLLIGIKARSLDVENCMVRHYIGDRDAELDLGTYTDTCYKEFLEMLHDVGWSTWSTSIRESKHLMILQCHEGYMRSKMEEQMIQIWFQAAWFVFVQNVIQVHLPLFWPEKCVRCWHWITHYPSHLRLGPARTTRSAAH